MIQKQGDYYIYDESSSQQNVDSSSLRVPPVSEQKHEAVGNIKQKIQAIRERFNQIKKEKQQHLANQLKKSSDSIFEKIKLPTTQSLSQVDIQIYIPDEILKLDQKLSLIQEKLKPNEILRRKIQNKGTLVDRIKLLHEKLKNVLEKSSEIIVNNIQNYCSSLDDKEEYLKILFLREAHTKIKGMKDEILVLQMYLKNLNSVQTKIKAIEPQSKTIQNHSQIIQLRSELSLKIRTLFDSMKNTYADLLKQIDSL